MLLNAQNFRHQSSPKIGILLINLGTPAAPTAHALRIYLRQFLSDGRVIEIPKWLWWWVLNGIIVPFRAPKSAAAYRAIWRADGSPLMVISQQQASALQQALGDVQSVFRVALGMSYGSPSIADALQQLRHCHYLLILPLYPQYASSTIGSVFTAVNRVLMRWRWVPTLQYIHGYFDYPGYIDALQQSIRKHWEVQGKSERLIFSFHGTPLVSLFQGDPYHCHCRVTARLVAQQLGLTKTQWMVCFQSRFGKAAWLQPYTDRSLQRLAAEGVRDVQIICPGFAADCLETLEEIAMENRDLFIAAGGTRFSYIPALNAETAHIAMLRDLICERTVSWREGLSRRNHSAGLQQVTQLREDYVARLSPREQRSISIYDNQ